jgi:hypothetical protein
MAVNRDKPDRWKPDIAQSVDMYNTWFMNFAPQAFRETRVKVTEVVASTLKLPTTSKIYSQKFFDRIQVYSQLSGCVPVHQLPEID